MHIHTGKNGLGRETKEFLVVEMNAEPSTGVALKGGQLRGGGRCLEESGNPSQLTGVGPGCSEAEDPAGERVHVCQIQQVRTVRRTRLSRGVEGWTGDDDERGIGSSV